jgi:hypothetical protein
MVEASYVKQSRGVELETEGMEQKMRDSLHAVKHVKINMVSSG